MCAHAVLADFRDFRGELWHWDVLVLWEQCEHLDWHIDSSLLAIRS